MHSIIKLYLFERFQVTSNQFDARKMNRLLAHAYNWDEHFLHPNWVAKPVWVKSAHMHRQQTIGGVGRIQSQRVQYARLYEQAVGAQIEFYIQIGGHRLQLQQNDCDGQRSRQHLQK